MAKKPLFTGAWTHHGPEHTRYFPLTRERAAYLLRAHRYNDRDRVRRVADGYTIHGEVVVLHIRRGQV